LLKLKKRLDVIKDKPTNAAGVGDAICSIASETKESESGKSNNNNSKQQQQRVFRRLARVKGE